MTSRGRTSKVDVESLERENDMGIDSLAERVGLLKVATQGIKNEADAQHTLLDGMAAGMSSTRSMLASVNDKFKMVLSTKQGQRTFMAAAASVIGLLILWYMLHRR